MNRLVAGAVSVLVCAVVASPVRQNWADPPKDDFPLSWFPMFAVPRPEVERPEYVIGLDAAGNRYKVDQTWWTAGGFNQGSTQLRHVRNRGAAKLGPFCKRVAENIARRKNKLTEVVTIQIMVGEYSREAWFRDGNHTPIKEKAVWHCPVIREAEAAK